MAIPTDKYQNISFSSHFRYMRLHMKGRITTGGSGAVQHGLGYRPFVRAYGKYPNGTYSLIANNGTTPDTSMSAHLTVGTDFLNLNVYDNNGTGRVMEVYYRIYAEPVV